MKNTLLLIFLWSFCNVYFINAQTPGEWTWMAGSNLTCTPVYGTQGVSASQNTPGDVYEASSWTDLNGDFWLYGGFDGAQKMWKYNVTTNMWTWMHGPLLSTGIAVYGPQGGFNGNVIPGTTGYGEHAEWVDANGDLWLLSYDVSGSGYGSLFKYSVTLNQWAFMHGNIPFNDGILGIPDPSVNPEITESPVSWTDNLGHLWLYSANKSTVYKYDISSNMWTRMHGDGLPNLSNFIGTVGQYSATNRLISGFAYQHWDSDDYTVYLLGPSYYDIITGILVSDNVMWQFDPLINQWRVVHSGNSSNTASFSSNCTFSLNNHPSLVHEQRTAWKDACNRFYGIDEASGGYMFCFDPSSNEYTLINGATTAYGAAIPVNFGTQGVSDPANFPGSILATAIVNFGDTLGSGSPSWTDNSGNFWKVGTGFGFYDGTNSLWRYVPDYSCIGSSISANFTPSPQQGCAPLSVNFLPQDTSSTVSFQWDFGDASIVTDTSSLATPSYTFVNPGMYTVQLIVSGNGSCGSGTDTTEMQITVVSPPVLTLSNDTMICQGNSVNLSVSGASSYSWLPVTGLNTAVGSSVLASPTASTMYAVSGTTSGCASTDSVLVTVNPLPILNSSNAVICQGDTATLNVSGASTYTWSPATGLSTTTGSSILASPVATEIYTITGIDTNSCVSIVQVTVTVEAPNVDVNSGTMCLNDPSASITLNANGATTYTWSPTIGLNSSIGSSVNCTASATTVYTVTGTSANGCVDSAFATVTVIPLFNITVNSADICAGESALLTVSGANTYVWSPATSLSSSTGTEVIASPISTTIYTVTGEVDGCVGGAMSTVTVFPIPNAEINVNPNPVSSANPVVVFNTNANGNTVSWSQNGGFISNLETFTHEFTANQPGSYDVALVLTNSLGCSDTAFISVIVEEDLIFYVPNTFTPDGNEFNQVFQPIITSGIDLTSYQLQIFNRWGEEILSSTDTKDYWDGTHKGEKCQDGTYTWKITFKSSFSGEIFQHVGHVNLVR